jgi:hypothetical protein
VAEYPIKGRGWPKNSGAKPSEYSNPADYDRYDGGNVGVFDEDDEAPKKPRRGPKPAELDSDKVRVTAYVSPDLDRRIRYRMADDRCSMSELISAAVEAYL